ncbi:MAG TPA: tetratricopeptide repeat protein [Caldithrix abyssi]|uniref:Tetratricopeptide repeat protein n=1 Tax=Caldithrix abyssi TaxID=187145 RepID=A0A7V1M279_CALAY|nr:tetratricopeptide repeat protein [Caldithrix abyssi]
MNEFIEITEKARKAYDEGNFSAASKLYLQALSQSPSNKDTAHIWAELTWTFYRMGNYRQTVEAAESTLEFDPTYGAREDLYRIMGYSHMMLHDLDEAEKYLVRSLEIDNASEKQKLIHYELAKLHFRKQDYAATLEALARVEEILKDKNPDYWLSALFIKGFSYYYTKKLDEAREVFRHLVDIARDDVVKANGHYGLAYIAFDKKDYLAVINLCEQITREHPAFHDKEALGFLMAASFYHLGRHDVFEQYYHQMVKNFPESPYREQLDKLKATIEKGTKKESDTEADGQAD